jgi:hypothetical protein
MRERGIWSEKLGEKSKRPRKEQKSDNTRT